MLFLFYFCKVGRCSKVKVSRILILGEQPPSLSLTEGAALPTDVVEEPVALLEPREAVCNEAEEGAPHHGALLLRSLLRQAGEQVDVLDALVQLLQALD